MSDNYYVLLELDPGVDDFTVIEAAIKEHQRSWSRQKIQGKPTAQRSADRYLALIPDMEAKLRDPLQRKTIADEARKEGADQKKQQLARLDELINMITEASIVLSGVKLLVRQVGGGISEADVMARLKARGKSIESGAAAPKTRPKLDRTIAEDIRDNLRHIRKSSLYDFLGLGSRSSPKMLQDAADEIYKELRRKGLTDPDSTARQVLAGHCKAVFKSAVEKEQYDNSHAAEAMEELTGHLEVAGRDGFLDQGELDLLVREARGKGVSQEVALEFIADYAQKRKWAVQKAGELPSANLKLCGYCDTLARTPADTRCHECGQLLIQPCPKCERPTPTQDECCSGCGASTGDAPLVQGLLREGKERLARGEFAPALACFDRALIYWENWQPAIEAKMNVNTAREALDAALAGVEAPVKAGKLEEARIQLARLQRDFGIAGTEALRKRIESGIQHASDSFRAAEALRAAGKDEAAVEKYSEALGFCADYQPALRALAASPPPSPTALQISLAGATARLKWEAARARGTVLYRVQRKAGGAPSGPADGTTICEVQATECHDADVPSGTGWYYAVFAIRSGVASLTGAVSGPHLRLADPGNVAIEAGDGQLSIRWTKPPGCTAVEVWRGDGAIPTKPGSGARITTGETSAVDQGLRNGSTYGYLIVARFIDPRDGRSVLCSPGVGRLAIPVLPPPPVDDLAARREDRTAILTWTPPARGTVQIRQTRTMSAVKPGLIIALESADRYGDPVPLAGKGTAHVALTGQGRVFFVPLSVVEQTAVVGRPAAITTLDDVTALEAGREGDVIHLTWTWPAGAAEVLVAWRYDAFPAEPDDSVEGRRPVTKSEYDRRGLWELRNATRVRHYFTVFVRDSEADICSTGTRVLEAGGLEAKVSYRVVVKRNLLRRTVQEAWVDLRTDEVPSLPPLQVVLKKSMPPLRPEDGCIIVSLNRLEFRNGAARIDLPANGATGFVKLFFKDGQHAREIRLLPSAADDLRLG